MNDREYLKSLGFEVGDRGRFSKEMKAALAARNGEDPNAPESEFGPQDRMADGRWAIERYNGLPSLVNNIEPQRTAKTFLAVLKNGQRIACGFCSECKFNVIFCRCEEGPQPPRYLSPQDIDSWSAVQ